MFTGTVWCNRKRVILESEMLQVQTAQAASVVPSSMEIKPNCSELDTFGMLKL